MSTSQTFFTIVPFQHPSTGVQGNYYLSTELKEYSKSFFAGTSKSIRDIIKRKQIPQSDYLYATETKNKTWNLSTEECKKAKLFISTNWTEKSGIFLPITQLPEPVQPVELSSDTNTDLNCKEEINDEQVEIVETVLNTTSPNVNLLPPLIKLKDSEKFRDENGNILKIEVRGERTADKIYFNLKDVSTSFCVSNLRQSLYHATSSYLQNDDYVTFNRKISSSDSLLETSDNPKYKTIYLTYNGLLKVLFTTRNVNAKAFCKWAASKLFTIQFGTQEQKDILATKITDIGYEAFKAVFRTHSNSLHCIYLLSLGKVKDIKASLELDTPISEEHDESTIYKFGFTNDMERRFSEHTKNYGKLPGVKVTIKTFSIIDPKFTSDAENSIRIFFRDFGKNLSSKGNTELVLLNDNELNSVMHLYKRTGIEFAGTTEELQNKVRELENEIRLLQKQLTLKDEQLILKDEQLTLKEENMQLRLKENALRDALNTNETIIKLQHQIELNKVKHELELTTVHANLKVALLEKQLAEKNH